MVLESLLSAKAAEDNIFFDFAYGVLLTVAALVASFFLFPAVSSMLSVVLLSIGIVPVLVKIFYLEEREHERSLLELHSKAIRFLLVFFLAVSLTVAAAHQILPRAGYGAISDRLFSEEAREISAISDSFQTGRFTAAFAATFSASFYTIVRNNLIVLFASFILSMVFGGGSAFVLSWNAMVFGVFLSNSLAKGLSAVPFFLLYALPELMSYYMGALSGGIFSVELSKRISSLWFLRFARFGASGGKAPPAGKARQGPASYRVFINIAFGLLLAAILIFVMGAIEAALITSGGSAA